MFASQKTNAWFGHVGEEEVANASVLRKSFSSSLAEDGKGQRHRTTMKSCRRRARRVHCGFLLALAFGSSPFVSALTTPRPLNAEISTRTENLPTVTSFVSPRYEVFIEDTDAYGIMYNGNYLRGFDRALFIAMRGTGSSLSSRNDWKIVSLDKQKFQVAAKLGDAYVVRGSLRSSHDDYEIWDLVMENPDTAVVYNSISGMMIQTPTTSLKNQDPFTFSPGGCFSQSLTVYRDEIDAHWPATLPLRTVLNYFERCRSLALGGASDLRRLQIEDEILVVVTGILSCSVIDEGVECYPGQDIVCESYAVPLRKGMVFNFYQTILHGSKRIAQGQVNLMLLDAKTQKPTRNVPEWLMQRIMQAE